MPPHSPVTMVMVDDNTVVCFGDMNEALAYIEH